MQMVDRRTATSSLGEPTDAHSAPATQRQETSGPARASLQQAPPARLHAGPWMHQGKAEAPFSPPLCLSLLSRAPHKTSVTITTVLGSGGPGSCRWQQWAPGEPEAPFSGTHESGERNIIPALLSVRMWSLSVRFMIADHSTHLIALSVAEELHELLAISHADTPDRGGSSATGPYNLRTFPCCGWRQLLRSAEDPAKAPLLGVLTSGAPTGAAGPPQATTQPALLGGPPSGLPTVPRRPSSSCEPPGPVSFQEPTSKCRRPSETFLVQTVTVVLPAANCPEPRASLAAAFDNPARLLTPTPVPPGDASGTPSDTLNPEVSACPHSSLGPLPGTARTPSLPGSPSGPQRPCRLTPCPPAAVLVRDPDNAAHPAACCSPDTDARAAPALGFRVHLASRAALRLLVDFGDSVGAEVRLCSMTAATEVTAFHQYGKAAFDNPARLLTPTPVPPGDASGTPSDTLNPEVSACPHSSLGPLPGTARTPSLPGSPSGPQRPCRLTPCPPAAVLVRDPDNAAHPAACCSPDTDARAAPALGFRVHLASRAALRLLVDFGDSVGAEVRLCSMTAATEVTAFHQYGKEGVYALRAAILGHQGPQVELGPYYVAVTHGHVSVLMNTSSTHQNEVLTFAGSHPGQKGTGVTHRFPWLASCNVSFLSRARAGHSQAWHSVTVWYQMQPVSIYTNGTVFAEDADITFVAVTKETTALEFTWHFGDGPPVRTTSRSIRRRLGAPQWYWVTVAASGTMGSVVSAPHVLRVQRRVRANRLVSAPTALVNTSVAFECRINFGTDVAFLWDFGDGTVHPGSSSTSHIYSREGEFTVHVLAFNNVSSASLRKQLFVVHQPCQPPPVKNMGPGKVQVWRAQPLRLGVTFEAAVLCDISQGLAYTWSLEDTEGSPVALPAAVDTHRQSLMLPAYALDSGEYTATAKVRIQGTMVHSNYSVGVEVLARVPVAVISEGTHLFVPRAAREPVVLRGTQSFDPDHPGAVLSYHWTCTAARSPGRPCFDDTGPNQPDTRASIFSFAVERLSTCCDQFLLTLTVASRGQYSSEAQVFLSTRQDPGFRFLHISWLSFKDVYVNWNEELSLRAVCDDCGETLSLSYSWELFWVNATEKSSIEALCSCWVLQLSGPFGSHQSQPCQPWSPVRSFRLGHPHRSHGGPHLKPCTTPSWGPQRVAAAASDTTAPGEAVEDQPRGPEPVAQAEGAPPTMSPSSRSQPQPSSPPALDDFEDYYGNIQEAEPAGGRQPGHSTGVSSADAAEGSPGEGDNLLDPFTSADRASPVLTIDWPKARLSRAVLRGYTEAGITKPTVTLKPYSLSSGETYVLQASVASAAEPSELGRAQLYVRVPRVPRDAACQVQPQRGLEALTIFSVFCMSGTPDFHYEFSYWVGNASRHTLYRGRDTQYYFALPAGDPLDNYKVMVSTEITDGQGSRIQPCSVAVTVLPRYYGNSCLSEDLYNSSLRNLSVLWLMGSDTESRNYIAMLTGILSRLAKENTSTSCDQWSPLQDALISAVCTLAFADEEEMMDSVHTLRNLVNLPIKLGFLSAARILRFAHTLLVQDQTHFSGKFVGAGGRRLELILLISGVWEASEHGTWRHEDYILEEGKRVISDMLLAALPLSPGQQLSVSAGQMEFRVLLHRGLHCSVQSLGSVLVHLPRDLAGLSPAAEETQAPCYISQLTLFRRRLHPGGGAAGQVGGILGLSLYSCPSRSPIRRRQLRTPVTVEFGDEDSGQQDNETSEGSFVLLREQVHFHQFALLSQHPQELLQIHIEFAELETPAFPVLLLFSFSKKPSPSDFLVQQTRFQDQQSVRIFAPTALGRAANVGYLSLLDAYYDRRAPSTFLAKAVSYTAHFQWIRCLFWERGEWKSGRFSPQPGTSPDKVNCSVPGVQQVSTEQRVSRCLAEEPVGFIVLDVLAAGLLRQVGLCVATPPLCGGAASHISYDRLAPFSTLRRRLNASFEASDISEVQSPPQNLLPSVCMGVITVLYGLLVMKSNLVDRRKEKGPGYIFLQEAAPPGHQLYAVVVDTGFWSPARFTSRVFIVLFGESGLSETRELCCPERTLFERNSRHTFILSAPAQLGPLWKVRVWHDSSGPAPRWLLSCVMVKELQSGRAWFFPARCWLASGQGDGRGDGRVERELPCLRQGLGFWKLFCAKLTEALEGCHVWLSLCGPPRSHGPSRTQRLAVSLCLLCTHACLTALATAGGRDQLLPDVVLGDLGLGLLCALAASPAAQLLPLLFRCSQEAKGLPRAEPQGARTRTQLEVPQGEAPSDGHEGLEPQGPSACQPPPNTAAWTICGMVTLACGLGTGFLGYRFLPAQCAQWLLLLSLSVVCCAFITQPLLVLAARQRERHLRRARPPSRAQLRVTRERTKRAHRAQAALRGLAMHGLTLLLLTWLTHGAFSTAAEHALNRAIRKALASSARCSPGAGDRSDCRLSSLLDALLTGGPSAAGAPGAQPPGPSPAPLEDSLPLWSPDPRGLEDQNLTHGGPGHCLLSPGRTRLEAQALLSTLRARGWAAASMRLVLYHPPSQLFTSIALRAQPLPAAWVESFRVFWGSSSYHHVLPELPALGAALAYYAACGLLSLHAGDVAQQLRGGPCQGPLDLSLMALWSQRARWLRGLLLFLWTLRCISLPGLLHVASSCCLRMRMRGLVSGVSTAVLVGALVLAAHTHLRHLLSAAWTLPPRTFAHSGSRLLLLLGLPGRSQEDSSPSLPTSHLRAAAGSWGVLSAVVAALCLGMLRVSLLTCFHKSKSSRGNPPVRLTDVAALSWQEALAFLGLETPAAGEMEAAVDHSHCLEEFSSLLDELLVKVEALSHGLELPALEEPRPADDSPAHLNSCPRPTDMMIPSLAGAASAGCCPATSLFVPTMSPAGSRPGTPASENAALPSRLLRGISGVSQKPLRPGTGLSPGSRGVCDPSTPFPRHQ
ncbi:Polycystic kidney disease protein 1-like 1 [Heterocephalus glaber]|uniref:Polycystin-1-like protein 1 n=1 Tax=Heterocephalus glaber TaxID=10181 RepID=G5B3U8_HETGA|nr:Polycystic kidney disease protein 1-like 1 [Heterocephalus glaber]